MNAISVKKRKAVLLLNVGTPDNADIRSVRKFLSEFLNDPFVIGLPWLLRKILVNCIIVPFRASKSTKLYEQLWEKEGSPLLTNAIKLKDKLAIKMGEDFSVFIAMRYGNPSINNALTEISKSDFDEIIVFPLFPQYALSTTETSLQAVLRESKKFASFPKIKIVEQFYDHQEFLMAWLSRARDYDFNNFDHIIFSFHGLPFSHIKKVHPKKNILECSCEKEMPTYGKRCYKATCYATCRFLADKLNLSESQFSVSFQSRLGHNWLSPFTDNLLTELANEGKKNILIFAPSFVADCLETKVELGIEYEELFRKAGGEKLQLVESLNESDAWVNALNSIIQDSI